MHPCSHAREDNHDKYIILVAGLVAGVVAFIQSQMLWITVFATVLAMVLASLGVWFRRGPFWRWFVRRREFKITGANLKNLRIGVSTHTIEILPRFAAACSGYVDIRFVRCKTLWRLSQPVPSTYIHIVDCRYNPRPEQERDDTRTRPENHGGGYRVFFGTDPPEFKQDTGIGLGITVEASRYWSGYLSVELQVPGKPKRSYGRRRASVGRFRLGEVLAQYLENHVLRFKAFLARVPHIPTPARTESPQERVKP